MKAITRYLLEVDNSYDAIHKKTHGTLEYFLPEDFHDNDPNKTVKVKGMFPQVGKVHSVPRNDKFGLKSGDTVIFHHFVKDNIIEGNIYWATDNDILSKVTDGDFEMFNERLMVQRLESEEVDKNGISIISTELYKPNEAVVTAVPANSSFAIGDKIATFKKEHFYSFMYGDKEMFMVRSDISIPYIFREDDIELVGGWVLVDALDEDFDHTSPSGIITKGMKRRGRIVKAPKESEFEEGQVVVYQKRAFFQHRIDEKDYYFVNPTVYDAIELILN